MMRNYNVDDACLRDAAQLADLLAFDATICAALRALEKGQDPELQHRICGTLTRKLAEAMVAVDKLKEFLVRHQLVAVTSEEIEAERVRRRRLNSAEATGGAA